MADKEIKKDKAKDESKDKEAATGNKSLIGWVVIFAVAIVCAGGGYGLSGLFAKVAPKIEETIPDTEKAVPWIAENPEMGKPWTHELELITRNLNEPGATRMIQFAVVMELSEEMDEELGKEFLESKKMYLQDWLGTYLSNLNLLQVQGGSSQNRMKNEIKESFNEILFPDTKPLVNKIMLKGYILQ